MLAGLSIDFRNLPFILQDMGEANKSQASPTGL